MIVKVGCDNVRRHIVGRMLYRSKGVDILTVGKNNDSSRVLPRTSADSSTSLHDPVNFAIPLSASPFLIIILHKSKGRLICQGSDGPGTEGLSLSKNNLSILMRVTLIVSGEIQVDIRLFVSLKSKECLKRNIKSILNQRMSADRTVLIFHVPSTAPGKSSHFLRIKITVMAVRTIVMRT